MAEDGPSAPEGTPGRRRPGGRVPIAERAARRQYLEQHGYDNPRGLAAYLRGDRNRGRAPIGRWGLVFHPVAGRLVLAFLVAAAIYLAATLAAAQLREIRVDTWTGPGGPDPAVQSGMRLAGCPAFHRTDDPVFPNWVRIDGRVYQPAGAQLPIGSSNIGTFYIDSGYTFESLRIYRVEHAALGERGSRILVRSGDAPAGGLFLVLPGCS